MHIKQLRDNFMTVKYIIKTIITEKLIATNENIIKKIIIYSIFKKNFQI